jgi:hypothetical protein
MMLDALCIGLTVAFLMLCLGLGKFLEKVTK